MSCLFQSKDIGNSFDRFIFFSKLFIANYFWIAYNDTTWIKIIIECFTFTKKLRREQQIELLYAFTYLTYKLRQ